MNGELLSSFAQFGSLALVCGVLLYMQMRQDEWTRKYMDELRKSIDDLTAAIKSGGVKK